MSQDPTIDADRNKTVGEMALAGACKERVVEVTKGYTVQSVAIKHNARTTFGSTVTELPTTGRFVLPTKLATSSVEYIHKQRAVAEPGKLSSSEQAKANDGADRMESARFVGESKITLSFVPSDENVALKGTGVIGSRRKLRIVKVVLKPVYRSTALEAVAVTT